MGGGYSEDIKTIIEAHANTFGSVSTVEFKNSYVSVFFQIQISCKFVPDGNIIS